MLCGEAGGINSTTPFVVAAATGRPLVDGDGMGRAYPELQMVTFTMHGVSATPMVLCDDKGNSLVLDTIDNAWTERLARAATVEMGGSALLAFYAMDGATAKKAVVRGTLSLCAKLGRALRETRAAHGEPVAAVASMLGAGIVFHGRIRDVERRTVGGFARGTAQFEGVEEWAGHTFSLEFQNEFLIAYRDGEVLVTTPDLIAGTGRRKRRAGHRELAALRAASEGSGLPGNAAMAHAGGHRADRASLFRLQRRLPTVLGSGRSDRLNSAAGRPSPLGTARST